MPREECVMKRLIGTVTVLGVLSAAPAIAQVSEESLLTYEVIQTERKSLAMGALDLTGEQLAALTPIYDQYLEEHAAIEEHRLHLARTFMAKYKAMADADAEELIAEFLLIDRLRQDLHSKYAARFGEVLPPRIVLRLLQVENKLDTIVNMQYVKEIPLAR
jgi:hypothetical protein